MRIRPANHRWLNTSIWNDEQDSAATSVGLRLAGLSSGQGLPNRHHAEGGSKKQDPSRLDSALRGAYCQNT
jgi:hypothetical protein